MDLFHGWFPALIFAVGAVVIGFDLRLRRIPNVAILCGLALAFIWHAVAPAGAWAFDRLSPGSTGVWGSAAAGLLMLAAFFPLWLLRLIGAGDVKLLALVGATFGASLQHWSHLFVVLLYIAVAGGGLVLGTLLVARRFGLMYRNLRLIALSALAKQHGVQGPVFDSNVDTAARMPYGVAIVVGSTAFVLSERFL